MRLTPILQILLGFAMLGLALLLTSCQELSTHRNCRKISDLPVAVFQCKSSPGVTETVVIKEGNN